MNSKKYFYMDYENLDNIFISSRLPLYENYYLYFEYSCKAFLSDLWWLYSYERLLLDYGYFLW